MMMTLPLIWRSWLQGHQLVVQERRSRHLFDSRSLSRTRDHQCPPAAPRPWLEGALLTRETRGDSEAVVSFERLRSFGCFLHRRRHASKAGGGEQPAACLTGSLRLFAVIDRPSHRVSFDHKERDLRENLDRSGGPFLRCRTLRCAFSLLPGPSGTQLAGWALRDEFASDRCDFPNQLVINPGFQVDQCLSLSASCPRHPTISRDLRPPIGLS